MPLLTGEALSLQFFEMESMLLTSESASIGGPSWTVTRTSGDGIMARPETEEVGTVSGFVYRKRPDTIAVVAAPDYTPASDWQFVAALPCDGQENDTLTSVATGAQWQVMGVEVRHEYLVAELEQLGTATIVYLVDDASGDRLTDADGSPLYELAQR